MSRPMAALSCPRCGRENDSALASCRACGQPLRTPAGAERRCSACGSPVGKDHRFCGHCGRPTPVEAEPMTPPPVLPRQGRSAPSPEPSPPGAKGRRVYHLVPMRHDGLPGTVIPVGPDGATCGRTRGVVRFEEDATVSPDHARFAYQGEVLVAEDLGSLNGTFLRLRKPRPLLAGDEIRLGRQLLRIELLPRPAEGAAARPWGSPDAGYKARLVQLLDGGGTGESFPLLAGENTIGREVAMVCFPGDRFVSARHARIDVRPAGMVLEDVGSSNGTFVRIGGPEPLAAGDQVLIGMQLLRVE